MGSLTSCLQAAGDLLPAETRTAILRRADELRKAGTPPKDAAAQAVSEAMETTRAGLQEVDAAMRDGVTLYEAPKVEAEPAKIEQQALPDQMTRLAQDFPGLMVRMDGDEAARPLADFLAAAKAEADEIAADGPLMQVAAECAIVNGV
jgi:hypothetical protein